MNSIFEQNDDDKIADQIEYEEKPIKVTKLKFLDKNRNDDSSDDDLNHSSKSIKINNIINGDDNVLQQHCRNYLYDSYLNITSILNSTNNDDDVQQQQRSKKIFGDHLEKMSELCFDQLIGSPPASPSTASTSSDNQCICSVAQLSDDEFNLIDNVDLNN